MGLFICWHFSLDFPQYQYVYRLSALIRGLSPSANDEPIVVDRSRILGQQPRVFRVVVVITSARRRGRSTRRSVDGDQHFFNPPTHFDWPNEGPRRPEGIVAGAFDRYLRKTRHYIVVRSFPSPMNVHPSRRGHRINYCRTFCTQQRQSS